MDRMHRIFCATPRELEKERRAFYEVTGTFNEREAMPHPQYHGNPGTITLRPESEPGSPQNDEPFLRRLIVETVALELGAAAWPEPMRSHLLGMQYIARRQSRRADFPGAASYIVQAAGVDAGWTVVAATPDEVHLVEIMILPELRGKGIGSAAIGEILRAAAIEGKPVRLHVNSLNHGAIRLYERLGFKIAGRDETQYLMEKAGKPELPVLEINES